MMVAHQAMEQLGVRPSGKLVVGKDVAEQREQRN